MQNVINTKEQLDSPRSNSGLFFLVLMAVLTLFSCVSDQKGDLEGLWVGGNIQVDRQRYAAIQTLLSIKAGQATGMNVLSLDTFQISISIDSNGLHIDTSTYALDHVKLGAHQLRYRKAYPIDYWRPSPKSPDLSRLEIRAALIGTTWSWDSYIFEFISENEVKIAYRDRNYSGQHCWYLKSIHDLCLLTIQGNFKDCEGLQFPLIQILNYDENEIEVLSSIDGERSFGTWVRVDDSHPIELAEFQVCDPHLNLKSPGAMYYYKGTKLEGGHYAIWKEIDARQKSLNLHSINGIVRVRFVVNCVGQTGWFESETFNDQYEVIEVPNEVTHQLEELTRTLRPWKVGQHPGTGEKIDTYYFISYRLRDGKIVDIFP